MADAIELHVEVGDIRIARADAVLLKHAQGFYGADGAVAKALRGRGVASVQLEVKPGELKIVPTAGAITAPNAIFFGTVPLSSLGYHEIRQFPGRALAALGSKIPNLRHLVTTVHGTNFGLDEEESALALVGGLIESWQRGVGPSTLEKVTLIELNEGRAKRLKKVIEEGLSAVPGITRIDHGLRISRVTQIAQTAPVAHAGVTSQTREHAFIAMPFAPELDDAYHYGILGPVRGAGLLCERVDQSHFDGLIIGRIRERIETAKVVIADLSMANPNVYLEVGYAWGRNRPTILLVRDLKELRFDVQGYRCLVYRSIRELETLLTKELENVK